MTLPRQCRSKLAKKRRMDECNSGAAFLQHVGVIGCPQSRARGHRHGANLHCAQVCGRKLRNIGKYQQHPLFLLESQIEQPISGAIDLLTDFGVGKLQISGDNRGPVATAFPDVAVHEMVHKIVLVRNVEPKHHEAVYCIVGDIYNGTLRENARTDRSERRPVVESGMAIITNYAKSLPQVGQIHRRWLRCHSAIEFHEHFT
jgi:hypothetical protein